MDTSDLKLLEQGARAARKHRGYLGDNPLRVSMTLVVSAPRTTPRVPAAHCLIKPRTHGLAECHPRAAAPRNGRRRGRGHRARVGGEKDELRPLRREGKTALGRWLFRHAERRCNTGAGQRLFGRRSSPMTVSLSLTADGTQQHKHCHHGTVASVATVTIAINSLDRNHARRSPSPPSPRHHPSPRLSGRSISIAWAASSPMVTIPERSPSRSAA